MASKVSALEYEQPENSAAYLTHEDPTFKLNEQLAKYYVKHYYQKV